MAVSALALFLLHTVHTHTHTHPHCVCMTCIAVLLALHSCRNHNNERCHHKWATTAKLRQDGAMAAVTAGAHRAAMLGADVVVVPEGVGDGPSSLAEFAAVAKAARVAVVATFLDSITHTKSSTTSLGAATSKCHPLFLASLLRQHFHFQLLASSTVTRVIFFHCHKS